MCPVCVANLTLVVGGATSGGGLTAFVITKFLRGKKRTKSKGRKKHDEEK
jgi:hypothetical protein